MVCLWCGKKIGVLRGVIDQQFCSGHHRKLARKAPDRVLQSQDATADYGTRELWAVDKQQRQKKSFAAGWVAFAMIALGALTILGMLSGGRGGPKANAAVTILSSLSPSLSPKNAVPSPPWWQRASVTMRHDFSKGQGEWVGALTRSARDWSAGPSGVRPGGLQIWERSRNLADYDLEFQARIEQRSLSWAFRAADVRNYYATKLLIQGGQGGPNAGIVRYAVLNGREVGREQFPVPLSLERGKPYRVRLSVNGDRFTTTVNGQVVGYWTDNRLSRGGFGFFSESGEVSTIQWMTLAERDSTLGRLLSYFSLIRAPWIIAPVPVGE